MKYPTDVPVKIVQLGAGGTWGHIAPHLYRLLYALDRPARYIICDGDIVEKKNLVRQNFAPADLGENKAKVLAERYSTVFGLEESMSPPLLRTRTPCGSWSVPTAGNCRNTPGGRSWNW